MNLPRRKFLQLGAGVAALPIKARVASAQSFPTRTITMVVPFVPGGTTDAAARWVGERMSATLGQPVVIENISGGSTKKIAAKVAMPPAVFRTMAPIASAKIPTSITYTAPPITDRATPGCENEI